MATIALVLQTTMVTAFSTPYSHIARSSMHIGMVADTRPIQELESLVIPASLRSLRSPSAYVSKLEIQLSQLCDKYDMPFPEQCDETGQHCLTEEAYIEVMEEALSDLQRQWVTSDGSKW